ncbi:TIR-like protein FxsC [Cryptosporangium aurantiacum]|uniref:TIR domain-containing protein n=1 Tax=Cryptosporangium aurantiacum TaxID=134849 RepID=A0A1M7L3K5_9ACTN|nr:TIR-like protein FxsC [Cryptosporangium aurantiacum]SHM71872.1 TIR domain-containing protein [Cryptosporangium aurantiacum]
MSPRRWRLGRPQPTTPAQTFVGSAPPETGPAFFLSYARTPQSAGVLADPDSGVKQLYADLSNRVRQLLPLGAAQEAGFMDARMEAGDLWHDELFHNLGAARAFVALLSPPYLQRSVWCPMEWDYFARRVVQHQIDTTRSARATAIIPVLWTPIGDAEPPIVAAVQRFIPPPVVTPERIQLYEQEGLLGMLDVDPVAYRAVVWSLARQIQKTLATVSVGPVTDTSTDNLRRSFTDGA